MTKCISENLCKDEKELNESGVVLMANVPENKLKPNKKRGRVKVTDPNVAIVVY